MNSNMNELQKWALAKGATADEIKILTLSSTQPGPIQDQLMANLAKYENDQDTLTPGKDTAIAMMLERGRSGDITVDVKNVMTAMGVDRESIPIKTETFSSDLLPGVIAALTHGNAKPEAPAEPAPEAPAASEPEAPTEPVAEPDEPAAPEAPAAPAESETPEAPAEPEAPAKPTEPAEPAAPAEPEKPKRRSRAGAAPAEKPAPRRKTKFSINKAIAGTLFQTGAEASGRNLRAFLLSLPEYKPQDVALMADSEVAAIFEGNFVTINANGGTMVFSKAAYSELLACLIGNDAYFIPSDDNSESAAE